MTMNFGIIVGTGKMPEVIAAEAKSQGNRVVAVALEGLADESIGDFADTVGRFNAGKLGAIIKFFKDNGVHKAVFAGKIPKSLLYKGGFKPDLRVVSALFRLKDRGDDTIIEAVIGEFKKDGIEFLDMKEFCKNLMTPKGTLTAKQPSKAQLQDIEFGFKIAKEIGALDIGQTVVVKNKAVMAVEAIEGTDEAIKRGGTLAGDGAVVVKVSRPHQNMRFDVPVVGPDTLESMIQCRASVLAVEAGKSIFIGRPEFLGRADKAGIVVAGV